MYNTSRGLAGKARREHRRSRAARLYTDQLVEEYLEPEDEPAISLVPIRNRGEFRPTDPALANNNDPDDSGVGMQLELPLAGVIDLGGGGDGEGEMAESKRTIEGEKPLAGDLPEVDSAENVSEDKPAAFTTGPIRRRALGMKTMSPPPIGWAHGRNVESSPSPFSLRGFVYGCALGGAAAAVALLAFRWLLG